MGPIRSLTANCSKSDMKSLQADNVRPIGIQVPVPLLDLSGICSPAGFSQCIPPSASECLRQGHRFLLDVEQVFSIWALGGLSICQQPIRELCDGGCQLRRGDRGVWGG